MNGKQCTVLWYVDDVKVSHVEKGVVQNVINEIEKEFGTIKNIEYEKIKAQRVQTR